jgi:hypothetical protein
MGNIHFKKNLPKSTLIPEKFTEQKIFSSQFKDGGLYFFVGIGFLFFNLLLA